MANLNLHQSLTTVDQGKIVKVDLDNMVRWLTRFALETENDVLSFIFKNAMPGLFPTGEWGYVVWGDSGLHVTPEASKLDHRTSYRYGEVPRYEVKFQSLWGVTAPITIYERDIRLNLKDPEEWKQMHLAALARAIPNYFKYISFSIFARTKAKANNRPLLRDYISKYIEPSNGSTDGYKFYLSEGYGEINLSQVITKQKKTQHALKTRLDAINKELYKDGGKVEAKLADYVAKKKWIGNNMTGDSQKTLAVYYQVRKELQKIQANQCFELKYKVDTTKFEGFNITIDSMNEVIVVLNRQEWIDLHTDFNFTELGTAALGEGFFLGARVLFSDDMDTNEALIMHHKLIQAFVLPSETRYYEIPYKQEETVDYFYETRHTIDLVSIYPRIWVQFKSA